MALPVAQLGLQPAVRNGNGRGNGHHPPVEVPLDVAVELASAGDSSAAVRVRSFIERTHIAAVASYEVVEGLRLACEASGAKVQGESGQFATYCSRQAQEELRATADFNIALVKPVDLVREIIRLAVVGLPLNSRADISRLRVTTTGSGLQVEATPCGRGSIEMLRTFARSTAIALTGEKNPQVSVVGDEYYQLDEPPAYGSEDGERYFRYHRNLSAPAFDTARNPIAGASVVIRVPGVPLTAVIRTRPQIEDDAAREREAGGVRFRQNPAAAYVQAVMRQACREWLLTHAVISEAGRLAVIEMLGRGSSVEALLVPEAAPVAEVPPPPPAPIPTVETADEASMPSAAEVAAPAEASPQAPRSIVNVIDADEETPAASQISPQPEPEGKPVRRSGILRRSGRAPSP